LNKQRIRFFMFLQYSYHNSLTGSSDWLSCIPK